MPEANGLKIVLVENVPAGFKTLNFSGSLDENTALSARETLDRSIDGESFTHLIFDLTDLHYINSKGIGFLVSVHAHLSKAKQKLVLVHPNEAVSDVLSLVGINTILDTFNSPTEAYQAMHA